MLTPTIEQKISDFRVTSWRDPKDKPFAIVLTGELNGKAIKVDIFKRSIHVYVDKVPQKRIRCINSQFIEKACAGDIDIEAVRTFLTMARDAGMF